MWNRYILASLALGAAFGIAKSFAQPEALAVAEYVNGNELTYPGNLDQWIMVGTSLGSDYNDQAFDAGNPGVIGVVQMEPSAYRYFSETGEYADGTMFLLSFFRAEGKSEPQLQGFVQGDRLQQEIHVIDRGRFTEQQAFYLFPTPGGNVRRMPDGSTCVQCHNAEGDYRGTFIQFYPGIRDVPH